MTDTEEARRLLLTEQRCLPSALHRSPLARRSPEAPRRQVPPHRRRTTRRSAIEEGEAAPQGPDGGDRPTARPGTRQLAAGLGPPSIRRRRRSRPRRRRPPLARPRQRYNPRACSDSIAPAGRSCSAPWCWRSPAPGCGGRWWAVPGVALALTFLFFFRDPERPLPADQSLIVSPADGLRDGGRPGGRRCAARHVAADHDLPLAARRAREPVAGLGTRHAASRTRPGSSCRPTSPRAARVNEQSEVWVDHDGRTAVYRQVVGLLARRVVARVREGDDAGRRASASAS